MKKFDVILDCNGMTIINRRPWKQASVSGLVYAIVRQAGAFFNEPQKMLRLVAGGLWKPLNSNIEDEHGALVISIRYGGEVYTRVVK